MGERCVWVILRWGLRHCSSGRLAGIEFVKTFVKSACLLMSTMHTVLEPSKSK